MDAFLDLGANIGAWALSMRAGGHTVLAVEAMLYNLELLRAS